MKRTFVVVLAIAATVLVPSVASAEPGFSNVQVVPRLLGKAASGYAYGQLSCPAATSSCTAVGPGAFLRFASSVPAGAEPTATTQTSGAWGAPSEIPPPEGVQAEKVEVNAVDCVAAGQCVAVGAVSTGTFADPTVATESGGVWASATALAAPAGSAGGILNAVWCASAGNCVATGLAEPSGSITFEPMVATESSGTWSSLSVLPAASGALLVLPEALACTDLDDCVLLGESVSLTSQSTLVWTESGGTWGSPGTIPAPPKEGFIGESVACPSATTCLAVGVLTVGQAGYTASATETEGTWAAAARLPAPRLSPAYPQGELTSIACPSATLCEAVGALVANDTGAPSVADAATWSSGSWSSLDVLHGAAPGSTSFEAVACPGVAGCTAIGLDVEKKTVVPFSDALTPVRPVTTPLAPTAVAGRPLRGGVVTTWQPPVDDGGAPVTSFTASVLGGGPHCTTAADACQLHGLVDGRRYRVEVTDTTSGGTSARAVSAPFVPGTVPTTPSGIHVALSATTARVSWHRSSAAGEKVASYEVVAELGTKVAARCRTTGLKCAVRLAHHHTYHLSVTATDATGTSRPGTATVRVD